MGKKRRPKTRLVVVPPPWTRFQEAEIPPEAQKVLDFAWAVPSAVYVNSRYQVIVREMGGGMTHLSIKRLDNRATKDWRDFQRIKNELVGEEREACEIFPAESRLVDTSNQYHLWVLPEGKKFPWGFDERAVMNETVMPGTNQRPYDHDVETIGDVQEWLKNQLRESCE